MTQPSHVETVNTLQDPAGLQVAAGLTANSTNSTLGTQGTYPTYTGTLGYVADGFNTLAALLWWAEGRLGYGPLPL